MINRRRFIQTSSWLLGGVLLSPFLVACSLRPISFGWVTDIHYALAQEKWNRFFFESDAKLAVAVELYNQLKVDFVIETGDFKDQNAVPIKEKTMLYLRHVEAILARFKGPRYHVLGNHDVDSISKSEFQSLITNTGIANSRTYYSFKKHGWRFVVLDACFRDDGEAYDRNNFKWYDTALPAFQLEWLRTELQDAAEPVVVFIHQPLDGEGDLYVNNARAVREILEKSNKVLAVLQGHRHLGGYQCINGIHYITQKAMVDFSGSYNNSYSVVRIAAEGQINIKGYRRAASRSLVPKKVVNAW